MITDYRRDIINRMFDKEMNKDFDAYRSANVAIDAGLNDTLLSYDNILKDQLMKSEGYKGSFGKDELIDFHKKYGMGSDLEFERGNLGLNTVAYYDPQNDYIRLNRFSDSSSISNALPTLSHEIAHEADHKYGPAEFVKEKHIPMGRYTSGEKFNDFLKETGKVPPPFLNGEYISPRMYDENYNMIKDNFADAMFNGSIKNIDANKAIGLTRTDIEDAISYKHHLPENRHVTDVTGIVLPKEAAIHPIEKRLILAGMIKNMGLRSLPIVSTIAESAGNVAGLAEAAQHPLTDPDEIGLRLVNTIAPNEQTEADVEYMKKLREYNSL